MSPHETFRKIQQHLTGEEGQSLAQQEEVFSQLTLFRIASVW